MTYTCIKCLADTDNDCDWCDDCIAESQTDDESEAPAPIPHQQNTTQEKT